MKSYIGNRDEIIVGRASGISPDGSAVMVVARTSVTFGNGVVVMRAADGLNWTSEFLPVSNPMGGCAYDPSTNKIYVIEVNQASNSLLIRNSTDYGVTWNTVTSDGPSSSAAWPTFNTVFFDVSRNRLVLARNLLSNLSVGSKAIVYSKDDGATWDSLLTTTVANEQIWDVLYTPNAPHPIILRRSGTGLLGFLYSNTTDDTITAVVDNVSTSFYGSAGNTGAYSPITKNYVVANTPTTSTAISISIEDGVAATYTSSTASSGTTSYISSMSWNSEEEIFISTTRASTVSVVQNLYRVYKSKYGVGTWIYDPAPVYDTTSQFGMLSFFDPIRKLTQIYSHGYTASTRSNMGYMGGAGDLPTPTPSPTSSSTPAPAYTGDIIIGGRLTSVNGVAQTSYSLINNDGSEVKSINLALTPATASITGFIPVENSNDVIIYGTFTSVNGVTTSSIARIDRSGTINPNFVVTPPSGVGSGISGICSAGDGSYVYTIATQTRLFKIDSNGVLDSTWGAGLPVSINSVVIFDSNINKYYVARTTSIYRVNLDGTVDDTFTPNTINGVVISMGIQPDGMLVAFGAFTTVSGVSITRLARFYTNGTLDTTFNPAPNNSNSLVTGNKQLCVTDSGIYVVGAFTNVASTARSFIARIKFDGSVDPKFLPVFAGTAVYTITETPDKKLLVSGPISTVNGVSRTQTVRLNQDGTTDTSFTPIVLPNSSLGAWFAGALSVPQLTITPTPTSSVTPTPSITPTSVALNEHFYVVQADASGTGTTFSINMNDTFTVTGSFQGTPNISGSGLSYRRLFTMDNTAMLGKVGLNNTNQNLYRWTFNPANNQFTTSSSAPTTGDAINRIGLSRNGLFMAVGSAAPIPSSTATTTFDVYRNVGNNTFTQRVWSIPVPQAKVTDVAFSDDDTAIAYYRYSGTTTSQHCTIANFDALTGEISNAIDFGPTNASYDMISMSGSGRFIAVTSKIATNVRPVLYNISNRSNITEVILDYSAVPTTGTISYNPAQISRDGRYMIINLLHNANTVNAKMYSLIFKYNSLTDTFEYSQFVEIPYSDAPVNTLQLGTTMIMDNSAYVFLSLSNTGSGARYTSMIKALALRGNGDFEVLPDTAFNAQPASGNYSVVSALSNFNKIVPVSATPTATPTPTPSPSPQNISGLSWVRRTIPAGYTFNGVAWSPELNLFASVASNGADRLITSPDGINWSVCPNSYNDTVWLDITWSSELHMFVAVGMSGTYRIMTSSDGITWTGRSSVAASLMSVTWSPSLARFVAVANIGTYQVLTSTDGITWATPTVTSGGGWISVTWAEELGLFVAVGGTNGGNGRVITSPDGINWSVVNTPDLAGVNWTSIAWSAELGKLVAVSNSGTGPKMMTSSDSINWTGIAIPEYGWRDVTWAAELGLFVVVANTGARRVLTSPDGIVWTTFPNAIADSNFSISVIWAKSLGILVASGTQFMTGESSIVPKPSPTPTPSVSESSSPTPTPTPSVSESSSPTPTPTPTPSSSTVEPSKVTWVEQTQAATVNNNTWTSTAWSPALNLMVSVASGGTSRVLTSQDGITWTARTAPAQSWRKVIWAAEVGLFVAVSNDGTNRIITSPDGIAWTSISVPAQSWWSIEWSPELTRFVVIGVGTNTVLTSSDGIVWTSQTASASSDWRGIEWSPQLSLFVAVADAGTTRVMTSANGINWNNRLIPTARTLFSVAWSPQLSLFVAVSRDGANRVITSPDGIEWTERSAAFANTWREVIWVEDLSLFFAVSVDGTKRTMSSSNGIDWYSFSTGVIDTKANMSATWINSLKMFVVPGQLGSLLTGTSTLVPPPTPTPSVSESSSPTPTPTPSVSESSSPTPTPTPSISESSSPTPTPTPSVSESSSPTPTPTPSSLPSGQVTWTQRTNPAGVVLESVSWAPALGLYVTGGRTGAVSVFSTSNDGINWTTYPNTTGVDWKASAWSPELGLFVNVNTGSSLITSPDGINWTVRSAVNNRVWRGVTWSPSLNLFVAVATNGTTSTITSPDGINWTVRPMPAAGSTSVVWAEALGMFVTVAISGTTRVYTSTDGINWIARTSPTNSIWKSITWSPELNRLVAVGSGGMSMYSTDAVNWVSSAIAVNTTTWESITWNPDDGIFAAVSSGGTNRIGTSIDGINWTLIDPQVVGTNNLYGVTWSSSNSQFVAVGGTGTDPVTSFTYTGVVS